MKTVFLLFSSADEDKAKINTTQMFHPAADTSDQSGGKDSPVQFFMQVGGVKYPVHPIGPFDGAQLYMNLVKAAGKLGSTGIMERPRFTEMRDWLSVTGCLVSGV